MLRVLFLTVLLLMVSCNSGDSVSNQDDDTDTTIDVDEETADEETADEDALSQRPRCFSEKWEEAEIVADYHEIYDFEVEKSEEKWSWTKDGHIASIYINGDSLDRIFAIKVVTNGDMYVAGSFTDFKDFKSTQRKGFFNIYRTDGTLVRYRFTKGVWGEVTDFYIDDKSDALYAVFNVESTEKNFATGENVRRSLLGILKDGKWSFKAWYLPNETRCSSLIGFKDDGWQIACSYSDGRNYYQAFIVIDRNQVYRRVFSGKGGDNVDGFHEKNNRYHFLLDKIGDPFGPSHPSLYTFDPATLCISVERHNMPGIDFVDQFVEISGTANTRTVFGIGAYNHSCVDDGVSGNVVDHLAQVSIQFDDGGSHNMKMGLVDPFLPEECVYHAMVPWEASESDNIVYIGGISSFDVEFLNREWGKCPEGEDRENGNFSWSFDPFIVAVDGENIFARQLVSSLDCESDTYVYISGDYVYLSGIYCKQWKKYGENDPITDSSFIHRIPKSWILQDEAKADDKLILFDNISE